jgi:citrate lyase beta subunit
MRLTLGPAELAGVIDELSRANGEFARAYPGDGSTRRPVHTVYGGADLFRFDIAAKLGRAALQSVEQYAPDPATFVTALGLESVDSEVVYSRVLDKLRREPVEDYRIDFEDGYGYRADTEEDRDAVSAASEMARALRENAVPAFSGIRIKSFNQELYRRSMRTLDLFLTSLLDQTGGKLPPNFVVCLPKIGAPEQVEALARLLGSFESTAGLESLSLRLEIMIETTQCILRLSELAAAAGGRCLAAHLGAFDFTSCQEIAVGAQSYTHPANDFARQMMQVAYAGTGIRIVDSVTNLIPKGNREAVHNAWRVHAEHVRHSLVRGIYQGWDLHPAQIPARLGAVYAFFLEELDPVSRRLKTFIERATQATMARNVFDDAATGQGMLNFFLQAISCGALDASDLPVRTGLTFDELRSGSFALIVDARSKVKKGRL